MLTTSTISAAFRTGRAGLVGLLLAVLALSLTSCEDPEQPVITSVSPGFAPADSLVIIQGSNLGEIRSLRFDGQLVNFNTSYNSDVALLFRVPRNIAAAEYTATLETDGGTVTFPFRVSRPAPQIVSILEETGRIGSIITIVGKNFFDPLTVYMKAEVDTLPAEIVTATEDTIRVRIPETAKLGYVYVKANGGLARSPKRFEVVNSLLVNDFDGNGLRADVSRWLLQGTLDQTLATVVQSSNPAPISGQFLKLSGRDAARQGFIGSIRTPTAGVEPFGITTDVNQTLLEFDINNNGKKDTRIIIVLRERDGSTNDFTRELAVDGDGWIHQSQPLSRFTDLNGFQIDPAKLVSVRFILFDTNKTGKPFEINIDNLTLSEIL